MIKTTNLHKLFTTDEVETTALNGVSIEIQPGEFVAMMGPSGCGKSTLLNILGLLDNPSEGEYYFFGTEVAKMSERNRANLRKGNIGFVFQSFNLIPVLNVIENVEFPCLMRKDPEPLTSLRARVIKLCEDVGLGPYMKHRPDELSGGQRQRVAIARALITNPELVLADEPTANLDSKTSDQIIALMQQLNQRMGVTFIFSTHDPRVMQHAKRVVHIADGKIVEHSPQVAA